VISGLVIRMGTVYKIDQTIIVGQVSGENCFMNVATSCQ